MKAIGPQKVFESMRMKNEITPMNEAIALRLVQEAAQRTTGQGMMLKAEDKYLSTVFFGTIQYHKSNVADSRPEHVWRNLCCKG